MKSWSSINSDRTVCTVRRGKRSLISHYLYIMQMNIWMGRDEAAWFISPFSPLGWIYSDCCERICKCLGMSNEGQWGEWRSAATCGIIWSWTVEEVELELLKLIFMSELPVQIEARYPQRGHEQQNPHTQLSLARRCKFCMQTVQHFPTAEHWAGLGKAGGGSFHSSLWSLSTEMNRRCKTKLRSWNSSFSCCYPGPRGRGNQRAPILQPWLAAVPV